MKTHLFTAVNILAVLFNPCCDISVWPVALRYFLLESQWVTETSELQLRMSDMWTVTKFGKREAGLWSAVAPALQKM